MEHGRGEMAARCSKYVTMHRGNALRRKLGAARGVAPRVGRHVGLARDDSI